MSKTRESSSEPSAMAEKADPDPAADQGGKDSDRLPPRAHGKDGAARSRTMSLKEMSREMRRQRKGTEEPTTPEEEAFLAQMEASRPKCRADCKTSRRPCLFISCKHHLYLDVNPVTGSIKINFPDKQVWELKETCALDVADRGGLTLEEVGDIMNLTRERIRQVESRGLTKRRDVTEADLDPGKPVR